MEPTQKDLDSPTFNAIWDVIKHWDIRTKEDSGYHGATGTNVMEIFNNLPLTKIIKELNTQREKA